MEIYAAFTVKRTSLAETVSLKSNNYIKINLNKEMPLATGQFTSNFLMDIKKKPKKPPDKTIHKFSFPNMTAKKKKAHWIFFLVFFIKMTLE